MDGRTVRKEFGLTLWMLDYNFWRAATGNVILYMRNLSQRGKS